MKQMEGPLSDDEAAVMRQQKSILRKDYMQRRQALTAAQRQSATVQIAKSGLHLLAELAQFGGLIENGRQPIVTLYRSIRGEVSVADWQQPLINHGWRTAFPVTRPDSHSLTFYLADSTTQWKKGVFGIWEPVDASEVAPDEIAVVVMPGLAFTRQGVRLGYGGGYYDRFLTRASDGAICIGVAYETQLVPFLPAEATDMKVNYVVTEREVCVCTPQS
jgi:5-formyltetrahydrofolate cyclo-ligase